MFTSILREIPYPRVFDCFYFQVIAYSVLFFYMTSQKRQIRII